MWCSKSKQAQITAILLLPFLLGKDANIAAANSAFSSCAEEAEYFVIAPPRDCQGKSDAGRFKFSKASLSRCYLLPGSSSNTLKSVGMVDPAKFEIVFSLPLENFVNRSEPLKGSAAIEMSAPARADDLYGCGNRQLNALVAYDVSAAEKEKIQAASVAEGVYKLAGLPRKALPIAMIENGQWAVKPMSQNDAVQGRYDIYYQKNAAGDVLYRVKCLDWNNECHGDVVGLLDGRYNYKISFSKEHAPYVADIIAGADALLSIAYEDN